MNLLGAYREGVSLISTVSDLNPSQMSKGFELLRQLTSECSLRTRAEALSVRIAFAAIAFTLETSPISVVSDVMCRVDLEAARSGKLLGTFPAGIDSVGLQLSDADLLMILMRSLPESARTYTVHHSLGDTCRSYRDAARRWELQQRFFVDQFFGFSAKDSRSQWQGVEWYS